MSETLGVRATRLKRAMADAHCGPLVAAAEVVGLLDDWASYAREAGGMTAAAWVRSVFGRGCTVTWFRRRAEAVRVMGEDVRRTWDHEAAVWVAGLELGRVDMGRLKDAYHGALKRNGGNPLELGRVRRLAESVGVYHAPARTQARCVRCERLDALLRAAGIDPDSGRTVGRGAVVAAE